MNRTILLSLALAPALAAQRYSEVEPNDTAATAQAVQLSWQIDANLVAGEQDWYSFAVASPSEVHVVTSGNFAVSSSVDTAVFLYDSIGTTLLAWDDNSRGTMSDVGVTLQPGNYTVMVIGKTGTVAGDYLLDFVAYAASTINTVEAAEPNSPPETGTPTPITLGDTFAGVLSAPTDEDWYSFTLTVPSIVQGIVYDDGGTPQLDNTLIQFEQETTPGIWTAIGTSSQSTTSHRALNLAHVSSLAPGNYAMRITSGTATNGTAPVTYSKVGAYAVRTRVLPFPGTTTVNEAPEPNSSAATAAFLALGDDAVGNTTGSADPDWYGFGIGSPTLVAVMTETPVGGGVTDTTVSIRDANGNTVSTATSGGPAGQSHGKLVVTIPTPGLYYIIVSGGVLAATGNYILHTAGTPAMFVASTFNQQPPSTNACPGSNALRPALNHANSENPQLGSHFTMRVNNALPNAILISGVGFSNTFAFGGTTPLPLDLTFAGAPGCFLRVDPEMQNYGAADSAGLFFWDIPIPNNPIYLGATAWAQVLLFDAANPGGLSVTNEVKLVVGNRSF